MAAASTERSNSRAAKQWKEPPVGWVWTCRQSLIYAGRFTILQGAMRSDLHVHIYLIQETAESPQ